MPREFPNLNLIGLEAGVPIDVQLLVEFVKLRKGDRVLDLGTGTGAIALALAAKASVQVLGIDSDAESLSIASANYHTNRAMLKGTVEFLRLNVTDARSSLNQRYFNMVVSNPPYYKMSTGRVSPYRHREQARRETDATFADFARAAHWALVHKGRFYFVHTPSRLVEIFVTLRALNLEPKQLLLLCPHEKRAAEIMIVEAIKDAKSGIIVHAPRILLN